MNFRNLTKLFFLGVGLFSFVHIQVFAAKKSANQMSSSDSSSQIVYISVMFAHLHIVANRYSNSISTFGCGQPLEMVERDEKTLRGWSRLVHKGVKGYIKNDFLSPQRPDCFQKKYPKFLSGVDLDLEDLYYWGRLYDQYDQFKTEI